MLLKRPPLPIYGIKACNRGRAQCGTSVVLGLPLSVGVMLKMAIQWI